LVINGGGTSSAINFSSTLAGVNNSIFTGTGFTTSPATGRLDSDGWRTTGFTANSAFGGSCTSSDCARGATPNGGVVFEGIWAFTVSGDVFMGVQASETDFSPGTIDLKITNNTGASINLVTLSFERWVNNDEDLSSSFNVFVSTDDAAYTQITAFDYTSPTTLDADGFQGTTVAASFALPATVTDGNDFIIRWEGNDAGGVGTRRDEFGIDDIQITAASLPIELTSFEAQPTKNSILLNWETATETNNDYFILERSVDGKEFTAIGQINGHGTTVNRQKYQFEDAEPLSTTNYYRLKQVDIDGIFTYHKVIQVTLETQKTLVELFPNPATNHLNLTLPNHWQSETGILIFDIMGRFISHQQTNQHQLEINLSTLPTGQYILRIQNAESIATKYFVKQE